MASERKSPNSKGRSASTKRVPPGKRESDGPAPAHFVICVRNDQYPASLELRKLYPIIEDEFASHHGMVRVIDESGEDYLFPSEYFLRVDLPQRIEETLQTIA